MPLSREMIAFSATVISCSVSSPRPRSAKRQLRSPNPEMPVEVIIGEECHRMQVSVAELESGIKRHNVTADREIIALRLPGVRFSAAEIARHLG